MFLILCVDGLGGRGAGVVGEDGREQFVAGSATVCGDDEVAREYGRSDDTCGTIGLDFPDDFSIVGVNRGEAVGEATEDDPVLPVFCRVDTRRGAGGLAAVFSC